MKKDQKTNELSENEKTHKIEMLRQMMLNAEKTMQSAKAMLLQLEGKQKTGRKRKTEIGEDGDNIVEGTFDGQIMLGTDGKQYPVPANYASKSKLVEGDTLKLTITPNGSFIYKQIGPAIRKNVIGIVSQDEKGNYLILAEGKPYKVLLASVTYFKAEPGDEVVITIPRDMDAIWAAIENVISKGGHGFDSPKITSESPKKKSAADDFDSWKTELKKKEHDEPEEKPTKKSLTKKEIADEWMSDIDELEKEIKAQQI